MDPKGRQHYLPPSKKAHVWAQPVLALRGLLFLHLSFCLDLRLLGLPRLHHLPQVRFLSGSPHL